MSRSLSFCILVSSLTCAQSFGQSPDSHDVPPAALSAYQQGIAAESKQQLDVALDRFQSSLKLAGRCLDCMEAIARTQVAMSDDKAALATVAKMASAASTGKEKARAESLIGRIYYDQSFGYAVGRGAYDKNPGKSLDSLKRAEAAMQRAAMDDPTNERARLMHAHTLAALKRDEDAKKEFVACAAIPGTSPTECARALRLSANMVAARSEPAPTFEAGIIDGSKVSLDSLSGKIVLIDFWGTWCPYCVRDSGYVQSMLDSFPKDRFVLLEVDSGDSEEAWKKYVEEHHMQGTQARDTKNQLQSLFHVTGFPTYILLDGDSTIRNRFTGTRGDLRGELRKLIAEPTAGVASASSASN